MSTTGEAAYEWDFEDRLVKVTKADGTVVENVYDMDGALVRTAVNGVGTDYLVDTSGGLSHVVAEIDGSGTVTALYVRAGDMLLEEVRGGAAKMYEADGLGSVRGLLDVSGAKTDTYAYEAFGSTVSSTGSDANPYRFAGERLVDSVGFYQNRARWLDTRTGRFVSVDPAEGDRARPLTLHPYLYGVASPATMRDPTGRDSLAELAVVGAITNSLATVSLVGLQGYLYYASRPNVLSTTTDNCSTCRAPGSHDRFGRWSWGIQWKLDRPSPRGGTIIQMIALSNSGDSHPLWDEYTGPYWEAWSIERGHAQTRAAENHDYDDEFAVTQGYPGTSGVVNIFASAVFYEGLDVPGYFQTGNLRTLARDLPSSDKNPQLTGGTFPFVRWLQVAFPY